MSMYTIVLRGIHRVKRQNGDVILTSMILVDHHC